MKQKAHKTPNIDQKPSREEIASAAYHLYVDSGYLDGHDQEHWLRAEELLMQKRHASAQSESQTKTSSETAGVREKTVTKPLNPIQLPWPNEVAAQKHVHAHH